MGRRARRLAVRRSGSPTTGREALAGPAYKGFARAEHLTADELLAVARAVVPPELATVTQAGLGYVEITAPGVDKGIGPGRGRRRAGHRARRRAGLRRHAQRRADVRLGRWRRVAVANAHPEVLALADEVTASNDADGVAAWLETLLSA